MNPDPSSTHTTLPTLLRDLRDETTTLLRQEVALAKAELKENAANVGSHVAHIAIGGVVGYAGLIVLLIGLGLLLSALLERAGLDGDLAQWLAPTVLGAVVGLVGYAMVAKAKRAMSHDTVVPRRTIATLRESKDWAQSKLQHSP